MNWERWRYCPECGRPLRRDGDSPPLSDSLRITRLVCASCGSIYYRNPTVGVAVIVLKSEKILLIRRRGSYEGSWCIPCGHVEWGEDVRESAGREFREETGLEVSVGPVFDVRSNFHDLSHLTVGIWFVGKVKGGSLHPGSDAREADFFPLSHLPEPMAFPTDIVVCEKLLRVLRCGGFEHLDKWWQDSCNET